MPRPKVEIVLLLAASIAVAQSTAIQIASITDVSSLENKDFSIYHGTLSITNATDSVLTTMNFSCSATIPSSAALNDVPAGATNQAILIYNSTITPGCTTITGMLKKPIFTIGATTFVTLAPSFSIQITPGSNTTSIITVPSAKTTLDYQQTSDLILQLLSTLRNDPTNAFMTENQIADMAWAQIIALRKGGVAKGDLLFLNSADPVALSNADHFLQAYEVGTENNVLFNPLTAVLLGAVVDPVYNICKLGTTSNCFQTDGGPQSPANFQFWALTGAAAAVNVSNGGAPPSAPVPPVAKDGTTSVFIKSGNGPFNFDPGGAAGFDYKATSGAGFQSVAVPAQTCLIGVSSISVGFGSSSATIAPGQTYTFSPPAQEFTLTGLGQCAASATFVTSIAFAPGTGLNVFAQSAIGPSVSTATPPGGGGSSQTFTLTFANSAGWQNLGVVDVLINDALDGRKACYVAFVPSSASGGSLYLVDDGGDAGGPYQGTVLPGSGTIQNGQCSVSGASSSVAGVGNTLTLTLAVTFTAGFGGNKVVFLAAQDKSGVNSGWQALGTWSVPANTPAGPAVAGIDPASGSSAMQVYAFTFTDSKGWQDISVANILINSAIDGRGACYAAFVPSGPNSGALYLVDDAGDAAGPYQGMTLPSAGSISNGQCSIASVGTVQPVSASGNTLTLTLAIRFSAGFGGNRIVYLAARSNTQNSGWQALGTVSVP
jgi:hypothetical protein